MKFKTLAIIAVSLTLPLLAEAQPKPKVSKAQAEKAALTVVKGGRVLSGEYEHESGKYIWSFDVKSGKETKEVWIDPQSGKVVKITTESAKSAAHEKD